MKTTFTIMMLASSIAFAGKDAAHKAGADAHAKAKETATHATEMANKTADKAGQMAKDAKAAMDCTKTPDAKECKAKH